MGDRTHYSAYVRKSDIGLFTQILQGVELDPTATHEYWLSFWDESDEEGKTYHVFASNMNYGGCEESLEAAKAGCMFRGGHGPGGEYSEYVFVGIGGNFFDCLGYDQHPVVRYFPNGPVPEDVEEAKRYWTAAHAFRAEMGDSGGEAVKEDENE